MSNQRICYKIIDYILNAIIISNTFEIRKTIIRKNKLDSIFQCDHLKL